MPAPHKIEIPAAEFVLLLVDSNRPVRIWRDAYGLPTGVWQTKSGKSRGFFARTNTTGVEVYPTSPITNWENGSRLFSRTLSPVPAL